VITGFRRVGKTYLMYDLIKRLLKTNSREEIVYINFEDERIINPSVTLLTDLIPEIQALFGKKPKYLFLDEIQNVSNWSKWVRRILDNEDIQIYISGSTSKMSSHEIPTELRGRFWEIKVKTLSFHEYLTFIHEEIDFQKAPFSKEETARFQYLLDDYLRYGGLPDVVLLPAEKKLELLQSYFQTVVQRDMIEHNNVENHIALRTMLKLLINSPYFTISKLQNIIKSMGIPVGKTTIDNYLSYARSSYFLQELSIFTPVIANQIQYPRKSFFVDTGFMTALSTGFSKNSGRLFENVIYQKISSENDIVYYYKDDNDYEVDFITINGGSITGLYQTSYDIESEITKTREVRSLLFAGKKLQCKNLVLITAGLNQAFDIPKEIKVVSFFDFWKKG
ncbi:MAG: ATP-binding protein, partial [Caldisericia bacterium]|nr:ATP-binding protein [Caldisericia bacterium]